MASKKIPVKTDLFRFVTLRTPDLLSEEQKELGFIFNTDKASSQFLKSVTDNLSEAEARNVVVNAASSFSNPFKSYIEVKGYNKSLYNFSSWLMRSRNVLSKSEVEQKITDLSLGAYKVASDIHILWDNLYYQALTRKSSYVRQACIQMLIADNFINKYNSFETSNFNGSEDDFLVRLANAKVVIDKAFTTEEQKVEKTTNYSFNNKEYIDKQAQQYYINSELQKYSNAILEVEKLRNDYSSSYNKSYEAEQKKYDAEVEKLMTPEVIARQKELQKAEDEAALKEGRDAIQIPFEIEYPKFEFNYKGAFSKEFTKNLSADVNEILIKNNIENDNIPEDVIDLLRDKSANLSRDLFSLTETKQRNITVNGVRIAQRAVPAINQYCFNISVLGRVLNPNTPSGTAISRVLMFINLGAGIYVTNDSHTLTVSATETYSSSGSLGLTQPDPSHVTMSLFPNATFDLLNKAFELSGEMTLSNGITLIYNVSVSAKGFGQACATIKDDNQPTEPIDVALYGIGKIGIADFRKVEQEICCYVPGHVSHIENVLAREYKERSTRSLLSVETTTETTSEKEVENLTDTTTTERNEMQSEVSSVLNEDQSSSYGASAGVSGKFGSVNYNANGYADFANSSSSSVSNANAQTYAQEITERALERIVQKTTKKQTSRILKEFEENNKHGFDNRDGAEHVSGVYRWVDIIYKNQLINYGKRLMYEFMVPEPARFYHDAIVKEENNNDSCDIQIMEKPLAPSELRFFSIDNSSQLNEYNYQKIASAYGVEVPSPPELYKETGVSFTKSQAGGDGGKKTNKAVKEEVDVPQGYVSSSAQVIVDYIGSGGFRLSVSVGNRRGVSVSSTGYWYFYDIGRHTDKVPVSALFNFTWVSTVNINIKFRRTEELFEQWQNEVYQIIIDAYKDRLREYNEALQAKCLDEKQQGETESLRFNPLFNRVIEKREIKRICIEMLTEPFNKNLRRDNYLASNDGCDTPVVAQDAEFENYAAHVKFFEQAFDWEIMAYLFYPYYWAKKCDWKNLFQKTEAADPIFQAFMQSGMARAVVPVRPGFEDAVVYYMKTGDIWNGGDLVIDQDDDLFISIAEEMLTIEGAVEKEWESRVPTDLTIIQKDTIGLDETGLPCCDFVNANNEPDEEDYENPIKPTNSELGVIKDGGISRFVVS